ncbi:MAG: minor capsid protein [Dysgonamonadaceae bacterium]|jgi:hypothetical protein
MNPTSIDIKDMLEADSALGLEFGDNLFIGREPDMPNNTVTIYDTGGYNPDLNLNRYEIYERPSIQIRVRNTSYEIGWSVINSIKDSLHARAHETWNGTYYSVIYCFTEIAFLDWDKNNRVRFVVNFNIQRRLCECS